ncbi:hypothetical protein B0H34DRAFT_672727 [Crassisporium funariophilum]|nr:hypothetical protein B0H34DRAFT_672727 [Crassisporium funariophilum]
MSVFHQNATLNPPAICNPLNRKNGLFKKAYELGVLCSVNVAVIIFGMSFVDAPPTLASISIVSLPAEERPGHNVKLYQYGSADIHDIVQRHIRVPRRRRSTDGEMDMRAPIDFWGNTSSKLADVDDDDADDVEQGRVSGRDSTTS